MSSSMSSRRIAQAEPAGFTSRSIVLSVTAFIIGAVLMGFAFKWDSALFAMPGFVGVAGAFMYWNTLFWASVHSRRQR
ncbi:MAG: hypothetical protein LIP23_01770 [Planctomycetes bacterium]|nr:hypothetical protein [Planctomycetota bacterium]